MFIFEFFNLLFFPAIFLFPLSFGIVIVKKIIFWLYLWQLKEYHIGRFIDHFRTSKGKELLINKINFLKIIVLLIFVYSGINLFIFPFIALFIIYLAEAVKALKDFFQKTIKKPVFTKKIIFLLSALIIIIIFFFYLLFQKNLDIIAGAVLLDLLIPLIVSAVVLLFQPLAVLGRNQIIKKAKKKREQFKNLLVVGIAGSYGKTSTKEFLAVILSEKFNVLKTKEHQNSEVGISQCILNDLNPAHEIFVCEMGAYNRGGIKLLCDIVKPKIGILTGINEQHMATFGSQENIIKAKYELVENLPEEGIAFFNERNKYCLELYNQTKIKKFLYGKEARFFGEENILGAMAVAKELGMTDEENSKAAAKIKNRFGGIALKETTDGLKIIDATYSANPDGVIAHLEYLKTSPGKKVIVMPCLIELGRASGEVHRRIGRKIGEICDLSIITTRDKFKEIKQGAEESASGLLRGEKEILFIEDPKEIFEKIISFSGPNDIILLESRVPNNLIKKLLNENI